VSTQQPPRPVPGTSRRTKGANKQGRELIKAIEAAGGEVRPSGCPGHFKVYLDDRYIGSLAGTPSDWRTFKNDIARLRRNGLNITSKGTFNGAV